MSSPGISWIPLSIEQRRRHHPHPASSRSPRFSKQTKPTHCFGSPLCPFLKKLQPGWTLSFESPYVCLELSLSHAFCEQNEDLCSGKGQLGRGRENRTETTSQGTERVRAQGGLTGQIGRVGSRERVEVSAERSAVPEQSGDFLRTMLGLRPGSPVSWGDSPLGVPGWAGIILTVGQKQSGVVAEEPRVLCPPRAGAGALGDLAGGPGRAGRTAAAADVTGS